MKIIAILTHVVTSGGGFNQALNAITQLNRISKDNFTVEVFTSREENIEYLDSLGIGSTLFKLTFLDKVITKIGTSSAWISIQSRLNLTSPFEKKLMKHNCDIVYFVTPSARPSLLQNTNYIFTVWDLCHRDHPEFPEVRSYGVFHKREKLYRDNLGSAYMVLVDSVELSKKMIERYGVDKDKILVMPFSPSPFIKTKQKYNLKNHQSIISKYNLNDIYFYYPAQFWPHKNHIRILESIVILKEKGIECNVVFSGKDHGNLSHIIKNIRKFNIEDNVKILGFVPGEDIEELYKNCISVVMPTYFGPTNLPPMEAWMLKKPIIYSSSLKDQVGDAAILIDPDNKLELANAMEDVLINGVDSTLLESGLQKIKSLNDQRKLSENKMVSLLSQFKQRRRCWH